MLRVCGVVAVAVINRPANGSLSRFSYSTSLLRRWVELSKTANGVRAQLSSHSHPTPNPLLILIQYILKPEQAEGNLKAGSMLTFLRCLHVFEAMLPTQSTLVRLRNGY